MPFFSIGSNTERLEVTLLGQPADPKTEGYDWIKARVDVEVGAFKGELEIYICVSDLVRFKEELELAYQNVAGAAEFKTMENQLFIRIELNHLGHVLATGYIFDDLVAPNKLYFTMTYDQTLLWHTISEIDEALFGLFPSTK